MRRVLAIVVAILAAALFGFAAGQWSDEDPPPAEITLEPSAKDLVAGQRFSVRLDVPRNLNYDTQYRLMLRSGDRWVDTYDLTSERGSASGARFQPAEGRRPPRSLAAMTGDATDVLQLPADLEPGRYRLKKWFSIHDEQARAFRDAGFEVSTVSGVDVAAWTDVDIVPSG